MLKDLTNQIFGRLTVLRRGNRKGKNAYWLCRCSCSGKVKQVRADVLQSGGVRSCGCLQVASRLRTPIKHGHCRCAGDSPEYTAYRKKKDACLNPRSCNARWAHDRGIQFLYSSFLDFLADVGLRPGPDFWLMRIDHDKDVEPGNLEWREIKRHRRKLRRKPRH